MLFSRKFVAAWTILALGLACTLAGGLYATKLAEDRARAQLEAAADAINGSIVQHMTAYQQLLHAGAALFSPSGEVRRERWKAFVERARVARHFPGIPWVGFAAVVPSEGLAAHVRAVRAEGFPDYRVHPEGVRESYTAVVLLEPFGGRNLRAHGLDMYAEPVRREAMERARDSGDAALSGRVKLISETEEDVQASFLLYVPVYRGDVHPDTAVGRRAALAGWAYVPFRVDDFMRSFLERSATIVDFEIFDGESISEHSLLFDLGGTKELAAPASGFWQRHDQLELAGRRWTVRFRPQPAFIDGLRTPPNLVFASGTIVSLLLFAIASVLASRREHAQALAARLTRELQVSHDELEIKVAERTAEIEVLFEASPMVIARLTERSFVKVNGAVAELTGYAPDELIGRTTRLFFPSDEASEAANALIDKQIDATGSAVLDAPLQRKDGSTVWTCLHLRLLDRRDPAKGRICLAEDITALRRAEEVVHAQMEEILRQYERLDAAERTRTEFLQTMRHELRTPLNAVIGFAELLVEGIPSPLPETQRQYALDILDAGQGLLKIVDEILDYTAAHGGCLPVHPQPIELREFLAERLRGFRESADKKGLAMTLQVVEGLPALEADPQHLRTIIDQLLNNAVKFTPTGGCVTLRASAACLAPASGAAESELSPESLASPGWSREEVEIAVEDSGVGISPEHLPRLFRPFAQLDAGITRSAQGTGMGLALSLRLAQLHGGSIRVDSLPGRGSTFTVRLPRKFNHSQPCPAHEE